MQLLIYDKVFIIITVHTGVIASALSIVWFSRQTLTQLGVCRQCSPHFVIDIPKLNFDEKSGTYRNQRRQKTVQPQNEHNRQKSNKREVCCFCKHYKRAAAAGDVYANDAFVVFDVGRRGHAPNSVWHIFNTLRRFGCWHFAFLGVAAVWLCCCWSFLRRPGLLDAVVCCRCDDACYLGIMYFSSVHNAHIHTYIHTHTATNGDEMKVGGKWMVLWELRVRLAWSVCIDDINPISKWCMRIKKENTQHTILHKDGACLLNFHSNVVCVLWVCVCVYDTKPNAGAGVRRPHVQLTLNSNSWCIIQHQPQWFRFLFVCFFSMCVLLCAHWKKGERARCS